MTEAEWLACDDPRVMLEALSGKARPQRLWQFAAFCWRRGTRFLRDEASHRGVEALEALARGAEIDDRQLLLLEDGTCFSIDLKDPRYGIGISKDPNGAAGVAKNSLEAVATAEAAESGGGDQLLWALIVGEAIAEMQAPEVAMGLSVAIRRFEPLVREFFGNPFRPVTFSSSWRTDTAVTLARQMYESRDFSAMPILADALQDAGCDSADVLDHCRGPGPHVRGCWVVDLVLGRE